MGIKVAVIGAGAAGLAAARRLTENPNFVFTVFEQSSKIGGTWVYDERTGLNEHGLPIHTSMYKSLRTNLPKEVMGYPGYPIKAPSDISYITASDILNFLKKFSEDFNIIKDIKFNHHVTNVTPLTEGKWSVTVNDLVEKVVTVQEFDAVMVCNGHYNVPNVPTVKGVESFKGQKIHSHDYRLPETFVGLTTVVIGAGPSGLDIALDISKTAKQVYVSHHLPDPIDTVFPKNVIFKPDIKNISENIVEFEDGSQVNCDCLFYCTGYKYSFPFLSANCGVNVRDNFVHPLYKHCISISNPTLCLVGLPFYVCAFSMFDLQIRMFLKTLDGSLQLPSKEEMLEDEKLQMQKRRELGFSSRESHKMGPLQGEYYDDLAVTGKVEKLSPVLTKLHNESSRRFLEDLINYRNDRYKIVNEEDFIQL